MSQIRSVENRPEREVRSALHKIGFRFRKNDKRLSGSPDIVFPHFHAVIFINGCFWHAHANCYKFRLPKTNTEFWENKFAKNKIRDKKATEELKEQGWRVGIVWECSITGKNRPLKIKNIAEKISLWLEEDFSTNYKEF